MIIIIIIIIMMTLKDVVRDFLQSPHCSANCLQHLRSSGHGAMVYKSRATRWELVTCNMPCTTWYDETAQLLSSTELILHLVFISLAETINRRRTGGIWIDRRERLTTSFRKKCHTLKPENSSPNRDSNPHWWQALAG